MRGSERSPSHGGDSKRVVSPMRARLNDIMNSVEMANESVQKAIESGSSKSRGREKRNSKSPTRIPVRAQAKSSSKSPPRERGRSPVARTENASAVRNQRTPQNSRSRSPGPGRSASNVQNDSDKTPPAVHSSNQSNRANLPRHNNGHNRSFKDVKDPDEITEEIETGEDDDLDHTLESWLTKQKKNVTVRRKKSQRNVLDTDCKSGNLKIILINRFHEITLHKHLSSIASADEVLEDDGIDSYGTDTPFSNIDRRDRGDGHDSLRYSDASEVEDDPDDYEPDKGNDAEVAGLQYMLAQALIGDENEDDNDDDEDNC